MIVCNGGYRIIDMHVIEIIDTYACGIIKIHVGVNGESQCFLTSLVLSLVLFDAR